MQKINLNQDFKTFEEFNEAFEELCKGSTIMLDMLYNGNIGLFVK